MNRTPIFILRSIEWLTLMLFLIYSFNIPYEHRSLVLVIVYVVTVTIAFLEHRLTKHLKEKYGQAIRFPELFYEDERERQIVYSSLQQTLKLTVGTILFMMAILVIFPPFSLQLFIVLFFVGLLLNYFYYAFQLNQRMSVE